MDTIYSSIKAGQVHLKPSLFQQRADLNRKYMVSLKTENLLQNFYMEAGLWAPRGSLEELGSAHWGWESPTCQLRGHFLGHWLSAAARLAASTGDLEVKGKAEFIVKELAHCQQENGGEWVGSIPTSYLDWIARGKPVWAPHYTLHKTLMGLVDMAIYLKSEQSLEVLENAACWFHRWSRKFSREEFDNILDFETGGMLEVWADLYGITGKQEHLDLINRYDRPRLFERLLAGEDVLTHHHANTTVPEIHGAARAYEVTGNERFRRIVEAYWNCAVTQRGTFSTGGQTIEEVWTPPFKFAAYLGETNQEHCVVYNMIRLADYLFRWTGDPQYGDYIERNLYNGILAQQHPSTGMIAYYLPLHAGGRKKWGTPTQDFWCCHGTLVQAHTQHDRYTYYLSEDGLAVLQYVPSSLEWEWKGTRVSVAQSIDYRSSIWHNPLQEGLTDRNNRWLVKLNIACDQSAEFTLKIRIPWWVTGLATMLINDEAFPVTAGPSSFQEISRIWNNDQLQIEFPKGLWLSPLPDEPDTVSFMDGPVVLAGLCEEEQVLYGDKQHPEALLLPDYAPDWRFVQARYRTKGQGRNLYFLPLYEISDEPYTVYFPIKEK
jgi:hypothetical protein